jgi:hypothetical protein
MQLGWSGVGLTVFVLVGKAFNNKQNQEPTITSDPGKANPSTEGLPIIRDPQTIAQLGNELQKQLQTGLKPDAKITQPVSYRVSVGKDGRILGYRPESNTATDFVNQTPLPKLTFIPAPGSPPETDPIGIFRATFQTDGKITVTPW